MTPPDGAEPAASAQAATPAQPAASSNSAVMLWNRLSRGEQLVLGGAAALVVIGDWILGALLNMGGVQFAVEIAAANLALLIVVHELRPRITWPIPFAVLVLALSVVIVVPAISDVLYTVRGPAGVGGGNMLGELFDWVCAAAGAIGAWMIWRAEPA